MIFFQDRAERGGQRSFASKHAERGLHGIAGDGFDHDLSINEGHRDICSRPQARTRAHIGGDDDLALRRGFDDCHVRTPVQASVQRSMIQYNNTSERRTTRSDTRSDPA
jgi:hypothetical protein